MKYTDLTLDIPIETAGKRGYRLAQARHLSKAARLNIASAAWAVRSRVRQRLLDLYTAREMEKLLKDQQSLQAENLRLVQSQAQAGAISAFELTQARIAADTTRLALRDAERQSAEAYAQLANAIGVPASALAAIRLSVAGFNDLPGDIPGNDARLGSSQQLIAAEADQWYAHTEACPRSWFSFETYRFHLEEAAAPLIFQKRDGFLGREIQKFLQRGS
jgi:outer membrane protein TolC